MMLFAVEIDLACKERTRQGKGTRHATLTRLPANANDHDCVKLPVSALGCCAGANANSLNPYIQSGSQLARTSKTMCNSNRRQVCLAISNSTARPKVVGAKMESLRAKHRNC